MNIILFILSDSIMLSIAEAFLFVIFLTALYKDRKALLRKSGTHATVKRGERSWSFLITFLGVALLVVGTVNSSQLIPNHKVIVSCANIIVITYLCIYSSYFRNKIIGWVSKARAIED